MMLRDARGNIRTATTADELRIVERAIKSHEQALAELRNRKAQLQIHSVVKGNN
jgi:hypothetical protein